jgi:hypothetical protein
MKTETTRSTIWRYAIKISLVDLVVLLVTALVCWLGNFHTLNQYGTGLIIAGVVAVILGGISAFGGTQIARNPTYRYVQSVMPNSLADRTKKDWADLVDSFGFLTLMALAGFLSIVEGWVITIIFP